MVIVNAGSPVSTTTTDDDLLLRFLRAAEERVVHHGARIPLNPKEARAAINWLRGLIGNLNENGSVTRTIRGESESLWPKAEPSR